MTTPPCKTCPWRRDQDAQDIPNFRLELAECLIDTCPDERGMGPDGMAASFGCHQSQPGKEVPCAGWLHQVGLAHPGVRLGLLTGTYTPEQVQPRDDLHPNYQEVLEKLRRTA